MNQVGSIPVDLYIALAGVNNFKDWSQLIIASFVPDKPTVLVKENSHYQNGQNHRQESVHKMNKYNILVLLIHLW